MTETMTTAESSTTMPAKKQSFTHRLYTGDFSWDFVGHWKLWYAISGVLIGISLLAIVILGLNLGIEFRGGADFQAPTQVNADTAPKARQAVEALNLPKMDDASVKTIGNDKVQVQTRALTEEEAVKVRGEIAKLVKSTPDKIDYKTTGAKWGQQITQQGLIALVVFLALVMLLIGLYFREWKMSVAAIAALGHDLVLTIGLYALAGFTFTPATLIGVLTILGYSLYDTVVVFDKVRENTRDIERQNRTYSYAANKAVNQVLIRSINTTIIGVLPVAALLVAGVFVLGTGPLKDLGLALFVGMIVGTYSSVFIATPVLAQMKEAEPAMKDHRARLARRAARHEVAAPKAGEKAATLIAGGNTTSTARKPAPAPKSRPLAPSASAGRNQPTKQTREQRRKG